MINIGAAIDSMNYAQTPNCGFDFDIMPKLKNADGSLSDLPVANSVRYDAEARMLYIEKCSAATFDIDTDCASSPYEIVYDIMFAVTANNEPISLNTDL